MACVAAVLVPATAAAATSADTSGRQSRTSHVAIAGGDIYLWSTHHRSANGGSCSLAFAVHDASGDSGSLTAGHCVATLSGGPSYAVFQTQAGSRHRTYLGDRLGTVSAHRFHVGKRGDNAMVALATDRVSRARIFTGGTRSTTTIPVTRDTDPHVGLGHVCFSGSRSGEQCGYTVRYAHRTVSFEDHGHTYRIHHEWAAGGACTSGPGDSGSPVYVKHGSHAIALGILSGSGTVSGHCVFFFTPVSLALRTLHLHLDTQHG